MRHFLNGMRNDCECLTQSSVTISYCLHNVPYHVLLLSAQASFWSYRRLCRSKWSVARHVSTRVTSGIRSYIKCCPHISSWSALCFLRWWWCSRTSGWDSVYIARSSWARRRRTRKSTCSRHVSSWCWCSRAVRWTYAFLCSFLL